MLKPPWRSKGLKKSSNRNKEESEKFYKNYKSLFEKLKKGKATLLFSLACAKPKQSKTDLANYERNKSRK